VVLRIDKEVAGQDEENDWWIYVSSPDYPWAGDGNGVVLQKQRFDRIGKLVDVPLEIGSQGVAHSRKMFAQGAQRVCFPLLRVVLSPDLINNQYSCYEFNTVEAESMGRVGPKIVDPLG
jgi:hypothetical protein